MSTEIDYMTLPLERFTFLDLTDAIGIPRSVEVLETSDRAVYTQRHTLKAGVERMQKLIAEMRTNETHYRERLAIQRNMEAVQRKLKESAAA